MMVSKDDTRSIVENLKKSKNKSLRYIANFGEHGFGLAVRLGLENYRWRCGCNHDG